MIDHLPYNLIGRHCGGRGGISRPLCCAHDSNYDCGFQWGAKNDTLAWLLSHDGWLWQTVRLEFQIGLHSHDFVLVLCLLSLSCNM